MNPETDANPPLESAVSQQPARFWGLRLFLRYAWYLLLLILIIILFEGPERGFRYLGL